MTDDKLRERAEAAATRYRKMYWLQKPPGVDALAIHIEDALREVVAEAQRGAIDMLARIFAEHDGVITAEKLTVLLKRASAILSPPGERDEVKP